ncbi:unnamed protein product [Mesocestoides corti]|uniref:SCP domain-containing protein n=1 Tax=Mesocestoides corti TaxID=53468 RepID=A0A158QTS6_MESCO|nr:unnamed protein product [Mesocestoides corti]
MYIIHVENMLRLVCITVLFWNVLAEGPSEKEREYLLKLHAELREEVDPPASNMLMLAIWAKSSEVGCAKHRCLVGHGKDYYYRVICLYRPGQVALWAYEYAGDLDNDRPYEQGESCSDCPEDFICVRKQCYPSDSSSARLPMFGILNIVMLLTYIIM